MKQRGEIATTVTVFTIMLMTLGVVIGSGFATRSQLDSTTTEAQSTATVSPNSGNNDVTAEFSGITTRTGTSQKQVSVSFCFRDDFHVPASGSIKVNAVIKRTGGSDIEIGSSLSEIIQSNREVYKCSSGKRTHKVFTYSSLSSVPGTPSYTSITGITFNLVTTGNWETQPQSLLGTLANIEPIFGPRPPTPTGGIVVRVSGEPIIISQAPRTSVFIPNPSIGPTTGPLITLPVISPLVLRGKLTITSKLTVPNIVPEADTFEYIIDTCDFDDKNADNILNGVTEYKNCGTGTNKKAEKHAVKLTSIGLTGKEITDALTDIPGGKRVVRVLYGYWRDYGTPQARKDTTGVIVEPSGSGCESGLSKPGDRSCLINMNGDKTMRFDITIPNMLPQTYSLKFVDEFGKKTGGICFVGSDLTTKTGEKSPTCEPSTSTDPKILELLYKNTSNSTVKLKWQLNRCSGLLRKVGTNDVCEAGVFTDGSIDRKSTFTEERVISLPPGSVRICGINLTKLPQTDLTDQSVRTNLTCTNIVPERPLPTTTDQEAIEYYASLSLYNSSNAIITTVTTTACENGTNCVDDPIETAIQPHTREVVTFKLGNITPQTQFFTIKVTVKLANQAQAQPLSQELSVTDPQNVYYDLKVNDSTVTGTAKTELDSSDISGNKCVNAEDATKIISKLANISNADQCIPEDINCDGVVNTLDLSVVISNLNTGSSCAFNLRGSEERPGKLFAKKQ